MQRRSRYINPIEDVVGMVHLVVVVDAAWMDAATYWSQPFIA